MKQSILRVLSTVTMTAFLTAHLAPLAEANTKPTANPFAAYSVDYAKARTTYENAGLKSFLNSFPFKISKSDQRFITTKMKGVNALPTVTVSDGGRTLIASQGSEKVTFKIVNAERGEYTVNDQPFTAGKSFEANFNGIYSILQKGSAKKVSLNPMDYLIPSAYAEFDWTAFAIGAAVVLGIGLLGVGIYYGIKYSNEKAVDKYKSEHSGDSSSNGSSPSTGGSSGNSVEPASVTPATTGGQ